MARDAVQGQKYTLVVKGELDERFAYLFDGMRMKCEAGRTTLTGAVRDQAQLHGFLERIEELGTELVSIHQASEQQQHKGAT